MAFGTSGVARAFPGGQLAHPEGQNEEENEKSLRKSQKTWSKLEEKIRKVELLPTRDCEAGYGPVRDNRTSYDPLGRPNAFIAAMYHTIMGPK